MEVLEAIKKRRTVRKFKQEKVERSILEELVDCARLAPSATNRQPLEYLIADGDEEKRKIFPLLRWASYIAPEGTPSEDERPAAYIIVLLREDLKTVYSLYDVGAAVENILISALNFGLGTCWMANIERESLRREFSIPAGFVIDCVIALGKKAEEPEIVELEESVKYYKENGVIHVPKRNLQKIKHWNKM